MSHYEVLHDDDVVMIDASPLDVRVADPLTGKAMTLDLLLAVRPFSGSVPTVRVTTQTAKAVDLCMLLVDMIQGRRDLPARVERYIGVPRTVIVDERSIAIEKSRKSKRDKPGFRYPPNAIVTDHAWIYLGHVAKDLLELVGTSLQLAREMTPTDKMYAEAMFRAVGTGFCEYLAGFKGRNVEMRGLNVDGEALLTPLEVEALIYRWLDTEWHTQPHGRPNAEIGGRLTPDQLLSLSVAQTGSLTLPTVPHLDKQLLPVRWAGISDRGLVEIDTVTYAGEISRRLRYTRSPHVDYEPAKNDRRARRKMGCWPFRVDDRDNSKIWLQDPEKPYEWHTLSQPLSMYPELPFGKEMNLSARKEARDKRARPTQEEIQATRDQRVAEIHSAESAAAADRLALRTRHQTSEARRDHSPTTKAAKGQRDSSLDAALIDELAQYAALLPPLSLASYGGSGFDGTDADLVEALMEL